MLISIGIEKMTSEAQEILRLIEGVASSDTAALDEIDLNIAFFLEGKTRRLGTINDIFDLSMRIVPSYTRSRDALKSIRPEGYEWRIYNYVQDPSPNCIVACQNGKRHFPSKKLYNEELAELHAIIQSIDYERSHANPDL